MRKLLNKLFPITEADIKRQAELETEMNESMLRWNDRMVKEDNRRIEREKKRRQTKGK